MKKLSFLFIFLFNFFAAYSFEIQNCRIPCWIEADYLFWKTKEGPLPVPLVTSASLSDPLPGALGQPGTQILLGDKKINYSWQNGFKICLGAWVNNCKKFGVETNFLILPKKSQKKSVKTSGEPGSLNVAVPIFDVTGTWGLNGIPGETVFILPGPLEGPGFSGNFTLKNSTRLQGSELNGLLNLVNNCRFRLDLIGGFRWLQLKDSLFFEGQTAALPNAPIATGFYNFKDSFQTNNNFYGAQLGLKGIYTFAKWQLAGFAKVALGSMNRKVKIQGNSQTADGNLFYLTKDTADEILPGGLFAEPTNEGSHRRCSFSGILESGISLSYKITECFEIGVGYNFLGVTSLVRPGNQINRKINPTRTALAKASRESAGVGPFAPIPFGEDAPAPLPTGEEQPKFKQHITNYWAQGLTASVLIRF